MGICYDTGKGGAGMVDLVQPSPRARALAKALKMVTSVREVAWTWDGTHDHLWVEVTSWSDADVFPVMDVEQRADPDGTITIHIHAVGDITIERTPVRPPAGACIL
jgi:hypothetical protein